MHFPETSIENLCRIGYTEDEARFLYLVATHSGYFSTRQYLEFTGAKSGEKSMAFTQKVLGKGTPRPGCSSERSRIPGADPCSLPCDDRGAKRTWSI